MCAAGGQLVQLRRVDLQRGKVLGGLIERGAIEEEQRSVVENHLLSTAAAAAGCQVDDQQPLRCWAAASRKRLQDFSVFCAHVALEQEV